MQDSIIKKIAKAIEIPSEVVEGSSHFEVFGNREIIIDGCKGILDYSENEIKVSTLKYGVAVIGSELSIKNYNGDSISIEGYIKSVEFVF